MYSTHLPAPFKKISRLENFSSSASKCSFKIVIRTLDIIGRAIKSSNNARLDVTWTDKFRMFGIRFFSLMESRNVSEIEASVWSINMQSFGVELTRFSKKWGDIVQDLVAPKASKVDDLDMK